MGHGEVRRPRRVVGFHGHDGEIEVLAEALRLVDVEGPGAGLEGIVRPAEGDAATADRLHLLRPGIDQGDVVLRPGEEAAEIAANRACADDEDSWAHGAHDIRLHRSCAIAIIGGPC